jgi:DNA-binding response OmpR family regulator
VSKAQYALVVDDETAIRRLTVRALEQCRFECDEAADGEQAADLLGRRNYDVVVTDLRMPRRHGHSLAVELLARGQHRPIVVVLTGVLEPRLASDLLARGVDDIAFKPVNFDLLGAKVRALCDRRQVQCVSPSEATASSATSIDGLGITPITMEQVEERLDALAGSLPVSPAAIELVNLIQGGSPSIAEVAHAIARDPLLTVEVLRLANSVHHSPGKERIDDIQQAIARVGDRQISELALAKVTICALAKTALPWINPGMTRRRSLATSHVIKRLHSAAELGADDEGLFLSSLLLPMSRLLLGLAFPGLYQQMVVQCLEKECTLTSIEHRVLPIAPSRAMAGVLARWKLSPRVYKPLQQAHQSYQDLAAMTEPLRSKVERLRVAELLGWMAVGHFEPWDEIQFPSPETMCRLRADDLVQILEEVRTELVEFSGEAPCQENTGSRVRSSGQPNSSEICYFKLGVEPHDLLQHLLEALPLKLLRVSREVACQPEPVFVNCLDVSPERLEWFLDDAIPDTGRSLVCNTPLPPHKESWGTVLQLPCSFAALAKAFSSARTVE